MDKFTNFRREKFFSSAVIATFIPVIIGLCLLVLPMLNDTHRNDAYWLISTPLIFSFICVAPIIAFLCVSKLKNMENLAWSDLFSISLKQSTIANFWVAFSYNIIVAIILSQGLDSAGDTIGLVFSFLMICTLAQLILWAFITFPLALICAAVFGEVAKERR